MQTTTKQERLRRRESIWVKIAYWAILIGLIAIMIYNIPGFK